MSEPTDELEKMVLRIRAIQDKTCTPVGAMPRCDSVKIGGKEATVYGRGYVGVLLGKSRVTMHNWVTKGKWGLSVLRLNKKIGGIKQDTSYYTAEEICAYLRVLHSYNYIFTRNLAAIRQDMTEARNRCAVLLNEGKFLQKLPRSLELMVEKSVMSRTTVARMLENAETGEVRLTAEMCLTIGHGGHSATIRFAVSKTGRPSDERLLAKAVKMGAEDGCLSMMSAAKSHLEDLNNEHNATSDGTSPPKGRNSSRIRAGLSRIGAEVTPDAAGDSRFPRRKV